ncbi:MAG: hypothetical protein KF787_04960 [Phycisphaeraceae bacterium]|nr:hypothetical protein [Phycisphaerae bacterium]MBX3391980.1 hypothetical protein [Phycisphaeraceae bacterium]HRJ49073.1 hypothetical protein [Phycisphaerales bacterium]
MSPFLIVMLVTLGAMLLGAAVLHVVPRLGSPGRSLSEALCRAPLLDLVITWFTVAPMIAGSIAGASLLGQTTPIGALMGLLAAVLGQVAAVMAWTVLHELANPQARRGPRIVHTLNRKVGRVRNHAAVWWTAWAVPVFWVVRVAQYFIYPPLTWLIRLPRYRSREWVNVSRHKFRGLVGHDLIWCLYCDWMTGVWSLGAEMLRNVESFWCPIRFDSAKKCENCRVDYPDIAGGWVFADADMHAVARVLDEKYPGPGGDNSWFGHPARLTVEGQDRVAP